MLALNFITLSRRCRKALTDAMEVASAVRAPTSISKLSLMVPSHAADTVEKLTDLHKKMNDLEKDEPKPVNSGPNVQNNMFVGSTS